MKSSFQKKSPASMKRQGFLFIIAKQSIAVWDYSLGYSLESHLNRMSPHH